MVITWYGQSCFKIQSGELTIVTDPFSKEIGLTPPRFRADVVLVSHNHDDHNNADSLSGEPFLIRSPGEYEIKGIYVHGISTFHDASEGQERGLNTMYLIEAEGLRILHMGDFGENEMRSETLDRIGSVDILMIPVGGTYTITGDQAAKIVKDIEPKFLIPMHYNIPGLKIALADVAEFLKEIGNPQAPSQEKLTIKKKEVNEDDKTQIVLLKVA